MIIDSGTQFFIVSWLLFEWVLRILALFIVPRNRKPTAGTAWLLIIFFMPTIGWLVFLMFGSVKLPKNRRDAQASLDTYIVQSLKMAKTRWKDAATLITATPPDKYRGSADLSEGLSHLPVFAGNHLEPLDNYDGSIQRIIDDMHGARSFVYVEYYILALDATTEPLFDAMAAAVKRGVTVRVLYDAYGSHKYPRKKEMLARMSSDGIQALPMLPLHVPGALYTRPDLRNHRKLVVIDGLVGYTGSLNMIARHYHRTDDIVYDELTVRLEGPIVLQLEMIFFNDWYAETGEVPHDSDGNTLKLLSAKGNSIAHVLPSGPGYEYENNLKLFNNFFYTAQHSITIVNPYFVPEQSLITALTSAAQRGIKIKLVNSEAIDQVMVAHAQRSYYEQMLRAGVEIYLYKKPALLHSKFVIIDDDACFVGSSNMDIRSFELNQELTLITYDQTFVRRMQHITNGYLKQSRRIHKKEWLQRPPRKQLLDNLARLTSSLQ